jgi:hypothetical protein
MSLEGDILKSSLSTFTAIYSAAVCAHQIQLESDGVFHVQQSRGRTANESRVFAVVTSSGSTSTPSDIFPTNSPFPNIEDNSPFLWKDSKDIRLRQKAGQY